MKSWSSESWKTIPTRRRTSARVRAPSSRPPTAIVPSPPSSIPLSWSTSVVLPAPLGPSTATRSPDGHLQVDAGERRAAVGIGEAQPAHVERRRRPRGHLDARARAAARDGAARARSGPAARASAGGAALAARRRVAVRRQRDRHPDLVLVGGQAHAVGAQVAVHAHVAERRPRGGARARAAARRGSGPRWAAARDVDLGVLGGPVLRLAVDARHEHAGEEQQRRDDDRARAEPAAALQGARHVGPGDRDEGGLDRAEAAPVGEQAPELEEVAAGVGVARAAAHEHDADLGRVVLADGRADAVLDDRQHDRIDAEVAAHAEAHVGVALAGARERGRPVVLEVPGGEQHERHRDDVGEPALDEAVDGEVGERLGHLDEAEVDRQLARDLADGPRQRPELLDAVGVAAAVADDEQRRRLVDAHVLVRRDRVQVGHANPRTAMVAATAMAGSASAAPTPAGAPAPPGPWPACARRSRARASRRARARRAAGSARPARRRSAPRCAPATASAGRRRGRCARCAAGRARRARAAGSAARSRRWR